MTSLKDHQSAMVQLLASGTAIPTSASRLAHALHDVLAYLNNTNAAPVAHTERRIDATTPGLNDAALAEDVKAVKPKQQSLESLLKQRDNTIRQLRGRVAEVAAERDSAVQKLKESLDANFELEERLKHAERCWGDAEREVINSMAAKSNASHVENINFVEPSGLPTQSGCRKDDTQVEDDGWIEWHGGECPVDGEAVVEVKFHSKYRSHSRADEWDWAHTDDGGDIVAYRVVKP